MLPLLKYVGSIVGHNSQTQNKWEKKKKKRWHFALRSEAYKVTGLCFNNKNGEKYSFVNLSGGLK